MNPRVNEQVRHLSTGWTGTVIAVLPFSHLEVAWDVLTAPQDEQNNQPDLVVLVNSLEIVQTLEERYQSNPAFASIVRSHGASVTTVDSASALSAALEDFGSQMVVIEGIPASGKSSVPAGLHR